MSKEKIVGGLGQVKDGVKEVASGAATAIGNVAEKGIERLLDYNRGKPSLLRIVTIPLGALAVGAIMAAGAIVEEYRELGEDFKRAREEEEAKKNGGDGDGTPPTGATGDGVAVRETEAYADCGAADGSVVGGSNASCAGRVANDGEALVDPGTTGGAAFGTGIGAERIGSLFTDGQPGNPPAAAATGNEAGAQPPESSLTDGQPGNPPRPERWPGIH